MKTLNHLMATTLLGMCLVVPPASAQQPVDTTPQLRQKDRVGRVVEPELPRGNLDATTPSLTQIRPTRAEYNALPPEVQKKIDSFKDQAKQWLERQEALKKQLSGATTDAERERIRATIQTLRDQWLERARSFREDLRERLPELKDRLRSHAELLDDAKAKLRENNHHPRDRP